MPEDETKGGVYVSLVENPERFTGYAGAGAANVWESIYRENCFWKNTPGAPLQSVLQEKGKHQIVPSAGKPSLAELEADDGCLEKRVFYRLISGMHASISMHLCWDYLNQTTGEWHPNLDCFISRFSAHPDRIQNIYFNYALLLRAVSKLRNYIPEFIFCTGVPLQDRMTKKRMQSLADAIPTSDTQILFDENVMFKDETAALKKDFRNRFRNVSRVMDCVGCDKCRLWGKVQTQGYGTALKVLFEIPDYRKDEDPDHPTLRLRRTEMVALVNTLDRVGHSLLAYDGFMAMWAERNATEAATEAAEKVRDDEGVKRDEQECVLKEGETECPYKETRSVGEIFEQEWGLFKEAMGMVLRTYAEMPGLLYVFLFRSLGLAGQVTDFFRWHLAVLKASETWDWALGMGAGRRAGRSEL